MYRVKKVPFIDNSLKQVRCNVFTDTLSSHFLFQVIDLPDVDGHRRRMVRKMYAVRIEFDLAGSLGSMFSKL